MAFASTYHDSDADDEYERSVMTSPILPTDDDTSATDSDPPSTEPTPTTFGYSMDNFKQLSPSNTILSWTSNQCADYISSLGLHQYCDRFLGKSEACLGCDRLDQPFPPFHPPFHAVHKRLTGPG